MKKDVVIVALMCIFVFAAIYIYKLQPDLEHAKIDYGVSKLYNEADMKKAVEAVKDAWLDNTDITLSSIRYEGDKKSQNFYKKRILNLKNKNDDKIDKCMFFDIDIITGTWCTACFEPNASYDMWIVVVMDKKGNWKYFDSGQYI